MGCLVAAEAVVPARGVSIEFARPHASPSLIEEESDHVASEADRAWDPSGNRNSLGVVIAFGIAVSTILGRFVIPIYYVLGERLRDRGRAKGPTLPPSSQQDGQDSDSFPAQAVAVETAGG